MRILEVTVIASLRHFVAEVAIPATFLSGCLQLDPLFHPGQVDGVCGWLVAISCTVHRLYWPGLPVPESLTRCPSCPAAHTAAEQSITVSSSNPGGSGAGIKGGPSAGASTPAGGGLRKTFGAWASAAEGLLGRFSGRGGAAAAAGLAGTTGAGGAKRSTAEVEAARERERLLRSGP